VSGRTEIKITTNESIPAWEAYVRAHPRGTYSHLYFWRHIVERTYKHKTIYLMATKREITSHEPADRIVGVLPIVHMDHFFFGRHFLSMPFLDMGGVLADDDETEEALVLEALRIAKRRKVSRLELRHLSAMRWCHPGENHRLAGTFSLATRSHKVSMLLNLPESSDALLKGFKAKLRSQVKKPIREGLQSKVGGLELLPDFYKVFSINMRDLGSPVHSKYLMKNVLEYFPDQADIFIIYHEAIPVACGLTLGFEHTLSNLWASSLRKYSRLSPNMLLYWTMLQYACDQGYRIFNFGRSTPDEGTFRFKKQWGAEPHPLHWQFIMRDGSNMEEETDEKAALGKAVKYWKKLPIVVTRIVGPMIRGNIGL